VDFQEESFSVSKDFGLYLVDKEDRKKLAQTYLSDDDPRIV
jgi:hypothetical protein